MSRPGKAAKQQSSKASKVSTCLPRCVALDERRELREVGVGVRENAVEALKKLVVAHNQLRGSSGVSICTFLLVNVRENAVEALGGKKFLSSSSIMRDERSKKKMRSKKKHMSSRTIMGWLPRYFSTRLQIAAILVLGCILLHM